MPLLNWVVSIHGASGIHGMSPAVAASELGKTVVSRLSVVALGSVQAWLTETQVLP